MLKLTTAAVIGAFALAPAAFAGGHDNGNNDTAAGMVAGIKASPKGIASELGGSPKATLTQAPSDRGWGKTGSALLGTGQVARGGKPSAE